MNVGGMYFSIFNSYGPSQGYFAFGEELIYYSIDNATWGTPFNCSLLSAIPDIEDDMDSLSIFPNPATDRLYINCEEKVTVEIINIQGQIVSTYTLADKTNNINISKLSRGIYNLRIISKNDIAYRKFIMQ